MIFHADPSNDFMTCPLFCLASGAYAQNCVRSFDVVFVVDASGSIQDQLDGTRDPADWNRLLNFVQRVGMQLSQQAGTVRLAEVVFSDRAQVHISFTDPRAPGSNFERRVSETPYFGATTNISGALLTAAQLHRTQSSLPRDGKIIILITDGEANVDEVLTLSSAAEARRVALVFAVGVTDMIDVEELRQIVGEARNVPTDKVIAVDDFQGLARRIDDVISFVCPTAPPTGESV